MCHTSDPRACVVQFKQNFDLLPNSIFHKLSLIFPVSFRVVKYSFGRYGNLVLISYPPMRDDYIIELIESENTFNLVFISTYRRLFKLCKFDN